MEDERRDGGTADERHDRSRLRVATGVVILVLLVLLVVVDTFGRLLVRSDFHVDLSLYALLVGALLPIVGVEVSARLPWSGPK